MIRCGFYLSDSIVIGLKSLLRKLGVDVSEQRQPLTSAATTSPCCRVQGSNQRNTLSCVNIFAFLSSFFLLFFFVSFLVGDCGGDCERVDTDTDTYMHVGYSSVQRHKAMCVVT